MELRHLRCFVAVAEELHFARAAARLHIEQSPLSRTIKDLEADLGVLLFERDRRGTQLTWAGQVFSQDLRRVFTALEQACTSATAAANGYHGVLRIALSGGIAPSRLAALLASCREKAPEVEIHLSEVSLAQLLTGLRDDLYDAGLAQSADVGRGLVIETAWTEPLMVAIPARHPLLAYKHIPIDELLHYALISFYPESYKGYCQQIEQLLRAADGEPSVVERVASLELLMTLVAAGYGLGLITTSQLSMCWHKDVVGRPLTNEDSMLTTYLLRADQEPSEQLSQFITTLHTVSDNAAISASDCCHSQ